MTSDPYDFSVFQCKMLLSLRHEATLEDCLRTLMASVLGKALDYSTFHTAAHVFVNRSVGEAHVMVLRRGSPSWQAVEELALYREGVGTRTDSHRLPRYRRVAIPRDSEVLASLNEPSDPRLLKLPVEIAGLLQAGGMEVDSGPLESPEDQEILVVPLSRQRFRRLGALLLFGDPPPDAPTLEGSEGEGVIAFGQGVSRLIVSVFQSLYDMQAHTYLPSYYRPQRKAVALLCAEIRHFDTVGRLLESRRDMSQEDGSACLRELVNLFSQTVADVVERYRGRLDQLWGGGLLAVFGEYVDSPGDAAVSACMRAVQSAAEAVPLFDKAKTQWFEERFCLSRFERSRLEHVTVTLGVSVSFGEVEFAYVGSKYHRQYMAFGKHVDIVKELARQSGRADLDVGDERFQAPILATRPVFLRARKECITDRENEPVGRVDTSVLLKLPGRQEGFPVFTLWPGNVLTSS